ncbi:(2Fe-2S)-binding protein [Mycobacterium paraffinicum]|uniref:(2Fe-2S)-binding protein n=1 Tax=Mycobacterium paraffinicum TaxID=53378 RepID=A0A1Q4HUZ9_9MYCO|nr:Rieske 2Fe-2S domain-containing protein [Mycobacterium paraffinicum]OJZ73533.1 (2Fe-2S)-binding protein [Mycobacterium paraffinicum]
MTSAPTWIPVATVDDLWEGEIAEFFVGDRPILLAHLRSGQIRAFDGLCPHAGFPLADGDVDGDVLTCSAHNWEFDLSTGAGINPNSCRLRSHAVRREGDQIVVSLTEEWSQ